MYKLVNLHSFYTTQAKKARELKLNIMNKENLPYFKIKNGDKEVAKFFARKFKKEVREKIPFHYLVQTKPFEMINYIKKTTKRHPYFLRFDIKTYYPSIEHKLILKEIPQVYKKIAKKECSRRFNNYLKKELPLFLSHSPYKKGIPLGSSLSHVLSVIFLLQLDLKLNRSFKFLRFADDYLVFCENKKQAEKVLKEVVFLELSRLNLELNEKKLISGNFHKDKVNFIGYNFHGGHFLIRKTKKEDFKKRINKITYLTRKKTEAATIKLLNNQILGFGHYYKFASCTTEFKELDAFIRMRLRRYIAKNKENRNKSSNLLLTNGYLQKIGLKSLTSIKEKYARKNKHIYKKTRKKKGKTCKAVKIKTHHYLEEKTHYYEQKIILEELKKITSLLNKINKKIK